jgi:hypothetical protein
MIGRVERGGTDASEFVVGTHSQSPPGWHRSHMIPPHNGHGLRDAVQLSSDSLLRNTKLIQRHVADCSCDMEQGANLFGFMQPNDERWTFRNARMVRMKLHCFGMDGKKGLRVHNQPNWSSSLILRGLTK